MTIAWPNNAFTRFALAHPRSARHPQRHVPEGCTKWLCQTLITPSAYPT